MSMTRYNPFDSTLPQTMREAMDRMLQESFAPTLGHEIFAIGRGFPIDVYEDELQYTIEASMPGVKPEELKVTATNTAITIRAHTTHEEKTEKKAEGKEAKAEQGAKEAKTPKAGGYIRRERYTGEVTRVIDLPDLISPEKVKATYKHGVLILEVPKAGEAKPKKVDIVVEE